MEEQKFKVIIVEDVKLELKGTEEIFRHEIPNAEVIGTAMTESEFWPLMEAQLPDLVLLDLEPPSPKSNNTRSGSWYCWT